MVNIALLNQKDGLTGFHTKQGLYEYLVSKTQSVYARAARLSVIILDLDNFKSINDNYGHLVGDDALRHFCMAINKALRGQHFVARYGGDEFVVVMDDTPDGKASMEVAKYVKAILKKERFFTPKGHIRIKLSIGIASYPDDAKTARGLLEMADQALYYAKEHGRDRAVTTKSLKKHSATNKVLNIVKIGVIAIFLLSTITACLNARSLRGVIEYYQNISQHISYTMHTRKKNYNFSSISLKDGKKIIGWVIKEDSENIFLSTAKPGFSINPLKRKVAIQPIIIPKSAIESSINVLKE